MRDLRRCIDDVLEVVEQEQKPSVRDVCGEITCRADGLSHCRHHERGIPKRRQPHPEHSVWVAFRSRGCGLDRKARLACTTGTGEREQPDVVLM